ncbi:fasciclin domain-containing protein, partial [Vibrio parahaemolyticus]
RKGNGTATLKTVSGGSLTLMRNGDRNITVQDETGAVADITIYDVLQSNGVIFSVDRVLMPK